MQIKKQEKIIIPALIIILFVELFFTQSSVSMTFDEPLHITAGYSKIVTGDFRMNTEHPPLLQIIEGLPLLFLKPHLNLNQESWTGKKMLEFTRQFFFEDNKNPKQMLFYARMPAIILTLLLGLLLWWWTSELFGVAAGIIALFIYVFEPNVLAHGTLATTDIGFVFFAVLAVYRYWKFFNHPTIKNLMLAGVAMGLAQLTKYTAIFLWPAYLSIILTTAKNYSSITATTAFNYFLQKKIRHRELKHVYFHIISLAVIGIMAVVMINASYLFHGTGTPIKKAMLADATLDENLYSPSKVFGENKIINFIAEKIPNPLPYYYIKGLGFVINEGKNPNPNIIFGKIYERGAWHYFPAAFSVKTTITLILLLLCAIVLPQKKKTIDWQFILIPALVILIALSSATKQVGIRYFLGVFPFLIIWISGRVTNSKVFRNHYFMYAIILILAGHAVSSLSVFPEYLSYYNEFVGAENGWKYFTDSNVDWGQDFDKLVAYVKCKPNTKIQYFGANDLKFHGLENKKASPHCKKGLLAISVQQTTHNKSFDWLKNQKLSGKIGNSILLYNITNCTEQND